MAPVSLRARPRRVHPWGARALGAERPAARQGLDALDRRGDLVFARRCRRTRLRGSNDRHVYAVDAASGRTVWRAEVGGNPSAPAVVNGRVYVNATDATVYALSASDGRRLWATTISDLEGGFPAAPTVADGLVYAVDYGVTALEPSTGKVVWQRELECFGCPVAVAGKSVFLGARDLSLGDDAPHQLFALDGRTGATEWSAPLSGTAEWTPAAVGNTVYVVSQTEVRGIKTYRLEAFDRASGELRWHAKLGQSRFLTFSGSAVAAGIVVVPSPSGYLYGFRTDTGGLLWRTPLRLTGASAPAVANGVVFVCGGDHRLHGFELVTGKPLWSAELGKDATSPSVAGGFVYVGLETGDVVAFGPR
jgi:outer membrane protein assembly factor BamB